MIGGGRLSRSALRRACVVACLLVVGIASATAPAGAVGPGSDVVAGSHRARTPIQHFVFLLQQSHTFDNYFGTRKGVDGIPAGTCMPVKPSVAKPCVKPFRTRGHPVEDLGHTAEQFYREYNGGRMNGFVAANSDNSRDGSLAMGYYDDRDLPYYWNVADQYVLFDRFFSSSRGGSISNHMYAVAGVPGTTGRSEFVPRHGWGNIPTIFDRLQQSGVSWKFYIENYDPAITYRTRHRVTQVDRAAQVVWAPLLAYARFVDDPELNRHIVDVDQFYKDSQRGTLPAVSYIVPSGSSEHPPGRVQAGQEFVRSLLNELMRSSSWKSSAFLWAYDSWGGWYDHVRPPTVDRFGYGFRVPALLVSPYARKGYVGSETSDLTSVLAFIESNWHLRPLAARDRKANDLMEAFDFSKPARAPVLLTTHRSSQARTRSEPWPVYGTYAGALGLCATLIGVAVWRTRRRGIHPQALFTPQVLDGGDRP